MNNVREDKWGDLQMGRGAALYIHLKVSSHVAYTTHSKAGVSNSFSPGAASASWLPSKGPNVISTP